MDAREQAAQDARDQLLELIGLALVALAEREGIGHKPPMLLIRDRIADLRRFTDRDDRGLR